MDDLDTIIENADGETTAQPLKKRGRKPREAGAPRPQTGKKEKLSAKQLTGILYLGHATAAEALNVPGLMIQETEAEAIASALVDVLQHYDFEASAKTIAWANLVGTLATVYGLKIYNLSKKSAQSHDPVSD